MLECWRESEEKGSHNACFVLYIAAIEPTQDFGRDCGNVLASSFAVRATKAGAVADQHICTGWKGEGEEEGWVEEDTIAATGALFVFGGDHACTSGRYTNGAWG